MASTVEHLDILLVCVGNGRLSDRQAGSQASHRVTLRLFWFFSVSLSIIFRYSMGEGYCTVPLFNGYIVPNFRLSFIVDDLFETLTIIVYDHCHDIV